MTTQPPDLQPGRHAAGWPLVRDDQPTTDRHGMDQLRRGLEHHELTQPPQYVYVASSWRNGIQPTVVEALRSHGVACYDFRDPDGDGRGGFSWRDVRDEPRTAVPAKGDDLVPVDEYLRMVHHPVATAGYDRDYAAMDRADTFVLVLPCGRSAHLELGWAVGAGKRTAILLEDPAEPELMYRMVDHLATTMDDLLAWLGIEAG